MVASLNDVGVALCPGCTTKKLTKLNDGNGQSRVYNVGSEIYRRINQAEHERGDAPDPTVDQPGTSNPSLKDWDGYLHWEPGTEDGEGTNMNLTSKTDTQCTFGWTKPTYYANFLQSTVRQVFFVKECTGTEFPTDCEGEDPFLGTNSTNADDGTSATLTGLSDNTWHIGSVRMEWADENTTYRLQGYGYDSVANPSNGGYDDGRAIIFKTDITVTCNSFTPWFSTNASDACSACNQSAGTTYYWSHSSPYINNTCYFTTSTCATTETSWYWIGNPSDGKIYPVAGGCQTSGTATKDCDTDCMA